jgi:hypothetical protein
VPDSQPRAIYTNTNNKTNTNNNNEGSSHHLNMRTALPNSKQNARTGARIIGVTTSSNLSHVMHVPDSRPSSDGQNMDRAAVALALERMDQRNNNNNNGSDGDNSNNNNNTNRNNASLGNIVSNTTNTNANAPTKDRHELPQEKIHFDSQYKIVRTITKRQPPPKRTIDLVDTDSQV